MTENFHLGKRQSKSSVKLKLLKFSQNRVVRLRTDANRRRSIIKCWSHLSSAITDVQKHDPYNDVQREWPPDKKDVLPKRNVVNYLKSVSKLIRHLIEIEISCKFFI